MIDSNFWQGKRVFLTGHTGFKGAWASLVLHSLGAELIGYSLAPQDENCLYTSAKLSTIFHNEYIRDINNVTDLINAMNESTPDVVIHMAAQSLVIEGYQEPVNTFMTNVQGTVHVLEAIRLSNSVKSGVMVTTDKCYENKESNIGYTEGSRLGGYDPYSNSKACAEMVVSSYRDSFFSTEKNVRIASVRAGNVIGGGDWAANRLVPDCIRSFSQGKPVELRSPYAVRPWQHVLEPVTGYLNLAERLYFDSAGDFDSAWNFGPDQEGEIPARQLAESIAKNWGDNAEVVIDDLVSEYKETSVLRLDSSKAKDKLGWRPRWSIEQTLEGTTSWYKQFYENGNALEISKQQIKEYFQV